MKRTLTILIVALFAFQAVESLPKITIKGQRMFNGENQFFCRGLAYAPTENSATADPLSDLANIQRDIPLFKQMNVNCIRIYQFLETSNVQPAMQLLDEAGIYVILDLYDPLDNVNRADPKWETQLFEVIKRKIDLVSAAPNLLAFIAGNEVTNNIATTGASAYVKAAIRDVKSYLKSQGKNIPVGYAGADDAEIIDNMQDYFVCGSNDTHVDFYGINVYRWCSNTATFQETYQTVRDKYINYPVPVILTEFGCIVQGSNRYTREWRDVNVIFGDEMNSQFSGGIAYEYHTASASERPEGNYGITEYSPDESQASLLPEGVNLGARYGEVQNQQGKDTFSNYVPSPKTFTCPATSDEWMVSATELPPTPDLTRCSCLDAQVKCRTKVRKPEDITPAYGNQIGNVLGSICGEHPDWCAVISADARAGNFGRFSMCDALVKASLLMNYVWQTTGQCDFGQDANFQEFVENVPAPSGTCSAYGDSVLITDIESKDETNKEVTYPSSSTSSWSTSTFSSAIRSSTSSNTRNTNTNVPTSNTSGSVDNSGNTPQTLSATGDNTSSSVVLLPTLAMIALAFLFV